MATNHISDEWLHEYSQGDLEESRMGKVEEHLLICDWYRKLHETSEPGREDRKGLHPN